MTHDPKQKDLRPLPDDVQRAVEQFRKAAPPSELTSSLSRKLSRAETQRRSPPPPPSPGQHAWLVGLSVLLAGFAGATALLALRVSPSPASFAEQHNAPRQLDVVLDDDGDTWVPLSVPIHPKHAHQTEVYFEAPDQVRFKTMHSGEAAGTSTCFEDRCIHRWRTPSEGQDHTVHVQLQKPGQYEFRVTYVSPNKRSSERFVVAAYAPGDVSASGSAE
jgi:hypothetical protein